MRLSRDNRLRNVRSSLAFLVATAMMMAAAITMVPATVAQAAGSLTLNQWTTGTLLLSEQTTYAFKITNNGPDDLFNASAVEQLPAGVSYVPGSTTPAEFGDPSVHTDPVTGVTTLFWQNLQDIRVGDAFTLTFEIAANTATFPVGSVFNGTAQVYANTNPRIMPYQTPSNLMAGFTDTASGTNPGVTVNALEIAKSTPVPDGKYLRGAHTQSEPYTLTITNNGDFATSGVTVTDFLPAGIEFLGNGTVDHSSGEEYLGSGPLAGNSGPSPISPTSIATVTDPPGYPAGIYTKVVWTIGDLAPGTITTISYATGIPLASNAAWPTGSEPTPGSLSQGSNLDNNTGASTRQIGEGLGFKNRARVDGTFTGPVAAGQATAVSDSTNNDVVAKDVRVLKSLLHNNDGSTSEQFVPNRIATYQLKVDVSEYVTASNIVLTDTLPNGFCPVPDGGVADTALAGLSDCLSAVPSGTAVTGATYDSVTRNADGTFTLTFSALTVAANGTATVTYQAFERATYTGGPLAGKPTVAGDAFRNSVSLTATTTTIPETSVLPTVQTVSDSSSTRTYTAEPAIEKRILPSSAPNYAAGSGTYIVPGPSTPASDLSFRKGDLIWFQLEVNFPRNLQSRHASIDDYIPIGTKYVEGSYQQIKVNPADQDWILDSAASTPTYLKWKPQNSQPDDSDYVAGGTVVTLQIAVVVEHAAPIDASLVTGNLMKLRALNSQDQPIALRAKAPYTVLSAPVASIKKDVTAINGLPASGTAYVKANDVVSYDVVVTNESTTETINNLAVWDVLPLGITSANVVASGGGTVTDPGSASHPAFAQRASQSAITWNQAVSIAPGGTQTFSIQLRIPNTTSVDTSFDNTASIRSFTTRTNHSTDASYYPQNNVDTSVAVADQDAPEATDTATVSTPPALVLLTNSKTGIAETNNNLADQATIGEKITYSASITIPAMTSVYGSEFSAVIPTGVQPFGTPSMTLNGAPADLVTSAPGAQKVTASWGAVYSNTTTTDQVFVLTYEGYVTDVPDNTHGKTLVHQASLNSKNSFDQSIALPTINSSHTTTVVLPAPSLAKRNSSVSNTVKAGQTILYTLTPGNSSARPAVRGVSVSDIIPAGLTLVPGSLTSVPAGAATFADPVVNPDGTTTISANFASSVSNGSAAAVTYQVVVSPLAASAQAYANRATLSGLTLRAADAQPGSARTLSASATNTVTVAAPTVQKTVVNPQRTIGQSNSYSVTMTVPSGVNVYNATIVDQLPARTTFGTTTSVTLSTNGGPSVPVSPQAELSPSGFHGWVLGDLAADPTVRVYTVTYTTSVNNAALNVAGGTLTNTATARWNLTSKASPTSVTGFDKTSGTSRASVTITEPSPTLTKTVNNTQPQPGDVFGYTVSVGTATGTSVSAAHNVTVVDQVPVGVIPDLSSISAGGVFNILTRTITWTIPGPTTPATPVTLSYNASLAASGTLGTGGALSSAASITSYSSLPSGGRVYTTPISSSASLTPVFPRVTPSKSAVINTPASVGVPFAWRISAQNAGPATAKSITLVDTLPAAWEYQPGSALVGGSVALEPTVSGSTLTWVVNTPTLAGQTTSITYSAVPTAAAVNQLGSAYVQVNRVTTTATDNTDADRNLTGPYGAGEATASTRIPVSDIRLAKSHVGDFVVGTQNVWQLDVSNQGPDASTGVFTVTDTLPAGMSLVSVDTSSGWSLVSSVGQVATFAHSSTTLASAASLPPLRITVTTTPATAMGTNFTNTATVTGGNTFDPDANNNTASDTATVRVLSDLTITKTAAELPVAGDLFTWNIDVSNQGPSVSTDTITVTDTLPAGVTFVSANAPGWTVTTAGQTVTATRSGNLAVNAAASRITVLTRLDPSLTGDLTNLAKVTSDAEDPDPNPNNNSDDVTVTLTASAILSVQKVHLGVFVAGTTGQYKFTVRNSGPSNAQHVRLTDALPTGMTFTGDFASSDNWSVKSHSPMVLELATPLGVGESSAVTVDVALAPSLDLVAGVTNTVVATSPTAVGPATNTDNTSISGIADLKVTKSHTGDVIAGQDVTYTVGVKNLGPSTTVGEIVVQDVFQPGMTFGSFIGNGWTHSVVDGIDTFTTSQSVGPGATLPDLLITAAVGPEAGGRTLINTVDVQGLLNDPDLENNVALDPTPIIALANVRIDKVATHGSVVAGTDARYTVTVTNSGPSAASNVTMSDPLLPNLTLVSATASNPAIWTKTTGATFVAPTLPVGTSTFEIVATVNSAVPAGTVLTNTATVTTSTPSTTPGQTPGGEDSADVNVQAVADLSLEKSHNGSDIVAGESATYTIDVRNNGPSTAVGPIRVTDTLPTGFSFGGVSAGWEVVSTSPLVLELSGGASLASGASAPTMTLVALTDAAGAARTVTNSATVQSPTTDPDANNNRDSVDAPLTNLANLKIVKSAADTTEIGTELPFNVAVTNDGPSAAQNIVVTDVLPAGLSFVSAASPGWNVVEASGTVTATLLAPLAPGKEAPPLVITTLVGAAAYPSITNTASVTTSTPQIDSDKSSTVSVDVPPLVDLGIAKTHNGDFFVGQKGRYTVTVTNYGPTVAPSGFVVQEDLPDAFTLVGVTGADWSTSESGGTLYVSYPNKLGVGESVSFEIEVEVGANAAPVETNVVSVSTDDPDSNATNIIAKDPTIVIPVADVSIKKTLTNDPTVNGEALFDLAVRNLGPSSAESLVISDVLPYGLTYVSADGGADWTITTAEVGSVDQPRTEVTATYTGLLAANQGAHVVKLVTRVDPDAYPLVTNTASVTSGTLDPDLLNNVSSALVAPPNLVDLSLVKTHEEDLEIGSTVVYDFEVKNNGPLDDEGPMTITDELPKGLTFKELLSSGWSSTLTGSTLTLVSDHGLSVGESEIVRVEMTVGAEAYPSVSNTASVVSTSSETSSANNSSTDAAPVGPLAGMAVKKSVLSSSQGLVTWKIDVTNNGPTIEPEGFNVRDALPAPLQFVSGSGKDWIVTESKGVVVAEHPTGLAVGATTSFVIKTSYTPGEKAVSVVNTAVLTYETNKQKSSSAASKLPAKPVPPAPPAKLPLNPLSPTGAPATPALPALAVGLLLMGLLLRMLRRRRRA